MGTLLLILILIVIVNDNFQRGRVYTTRKPKTDRPSGYGTREYKK